MFTPYASIWRRVAEALVWALVALGAIWLLIRLLGLERGYPLVPVMSYTPYVPVAGTLVAIAAALLRRWPAVAAAVLIAVVLAALVVPRAIPGQDAEPGDGPRLTVLTANLMFGNGDPDELVALVRAEDVGVLSVQELTPRAVEGLEEAGLDELLSHRAIDPKPRASGSALYSRYPLRRVQLRTGSGGFAMPYASLELPGAPPVDVMAVHPVPPTGSSQVGDWERDLGALPGADPDETLRLLAGDFNATLDHAELRDLIATGYADAADAVGSGLVPTWPRPITSLPVTIDHVLVDERVYVEDVTVRDLSRSDHGMVMAELILPPG